MLCHGTDVVVVVVVVCRENEIGAEGGAAIATALATNTTLTSLKGSAVPPHLMGRRSCISLCIRG